MMLSQTPVAPILKFAVAFPLVYHYMYQVRHLMWDKAPDTLTNDDVKNSSIILGASALGISAGFMIM
jgi:succinate dehydrogenase/fumarate reductase cytochrome b subunit